MMSSAGCDCESLCMRKMDCENDPRPGEEMSEEMSLVVRMEAEEVRSRMRAIDIPIPSVSSRWTVARFRDVVRWEEAGSSRANWL